MVYYPLFTRSMFYLPLTKFFTTLWIMDNHVFYMSDLLNASIKAAYERGFTISVACLPCHIHEETCTLRTRWHMQPRDRSSDPPPRLWSRSLTFWKNQIALSYFRQYELSKSHIELSQIRSNYYLQTFPCWYFLSLIVAITPPKSLSKSNSGLNKGDYFDIDRFYRIGLPLS